MDIKKDTNKANISHTYVDENGIKVTVYKPQHPRLEEITFPRRKEYVNLFIRDESN